MYNIVETGIDDLCVTMVQVQCDPPDAIRVFIFVWPNFIVLLFMGLKLFRSSSGF